MRCPCCREMLWHCWTCWRDYHNGLKDDDYISPKYFGQPMSEMVDKKLKEEFGVELERTIIADKDRPYKEGEYH